ncbi:glycophorin-C [Trichomycterus rosablanca]|uniref:glycophorin-C n=1 Tax=Trichomycterus rosablanca TaxID=2290929 RepID=UPI002F35C5A0
MHCEGIEKNDTSLCYKLSKNTFPVQEDTEYVLGRLVARLVRESCCPLQSFPLTCPLRVFSMGMELNATSPGIEITFRTPTNLKRADGDSYDAVIGVIIAVVVLVLICLLVVLLRYMYRHKGTYHTNEAKGSDCAETADVALRADPALQDAVDDSKKEYFI